MIKLIVYVVIGYVLGSFFGATRGAQMAEDQFGCMAFLVLGAFQDEFAARGAIVGMCMGALVWFFDKMKKWC